MLISFEIHCFYGLWTRIYEYGPSTDLSSFRRPELVSRTFPGGGEKALEPANFDTHAIISGCEWIYDTLTMLNISSNMADKLECLKKFSVF